MWVPVHVALTLRRSPLTDVFFAKCRIPLSFMATIVDAGTVLISLTPSAELLVFQPTDKEYKQIAKYSVGT